MIILICLVINALIIYPVHLGQPNIVGEGPTNVKQNNNEPPVFRYPMNKPRPAISLLPNGPVLLLPDVVDFIPIEEPRITNPVYIVETQYSLFTGDDYPVSEIKNFLDENKAMVRRMYGGIKPVMDSHYVSDQDQVKSRYSRQTIDSEDKNSGVNFCPSLKESVTPYWARNNSNYKFAIVNYEPFVQSVNTETCLEVKNCGPINCRCTQDYTWHRMLAYDPEDNCRGIFMEWFKFPSCCVCKCF